MIDIIKELWTFMKVRKMWWLLPIIVMLVVFGAIILTSYAGGAVSPYVYILF